MDDDSVIKARRKAIDLLSRRDHSRQELSQKLINKGHKPTVITPLLEELHHKAYINESRLAENYIHFRSQRGFGPLRIQQELQARGIPAEIIAEHLNITDNAWLIGVRNAFKKQFGGKIATDFKMKAKQLRFLQYRGFTREQIGSVLNDDDNLT